MNQREIQIWNDAVQACEKAAWAEVQAMEEEAADGIANPARTVVRAVGSQLKPGDDRRRFPEEQEAAILAMFDRSG